MCSIAVPLPAPIERPLELIEREICELAAHIAAATCRWLLLVAEFDERQGWASWGTQSCAHWLSWRCSIGATAAREHVRVARRLPELPLIREAFAAGRLSYSKARALTRVATTDNEAALVEIAEHATGAQLERLVSKYQLAARASASVAEASHERRGLVCRWDGDMLRLEGTLDAEAGAAVLRALSAAEEQLPDIEGVTPSQRRADALVALASGGGSGCELVVHVDADSLAAEATVERCELEDGPPVAPETARRLGCDAAVVRVFEREGQPLSVGRRTRRIPPAIRRALRSRDGGCQFPGCDHQRYLHAHHIKHWARGGETALDNLVQLCSHHHRLVHEGGFRVERQRGGGLRFLRPSGSPIPCAVGGEGARGPRLEHQHAACGLAVDADTCRPRSAGDPMHYELAVDCLMNARGSPQ
jgi:hypothetical protein